MDALREQATRDRHTVVREAVDRARQRGEHIPIDGPDGLIRSIAGPLFYRRFVEGVPPTRTLADRGVTRALSPTTQAVTHPTPEKTTP